MLPSRPWLGIDYGSAFTKAVLVMPDGRWTLVGFDDGQALSNAVHAGPSELSAGAEAWRHADVTPEGFVLFPLRAGDGPLHLGIVDKDPADLIAATLRRVAGEAALLAGGPVEDVRMVVPAGWGPRRRTWWRRVVSKAGLGQVRLVEAPIATANRLAHAEVGSGARQWLIVDVGAGCEVSVVRRAPGAEFEVLSTMADPDAGGSRIDAALAEAATGTRLDEVSVLRQWELLASVQAAKHALAQQPAVTVLVPDKPPVVVNTAVLRRAAEPVFDRVGALAAATVANAEVAVEDLDGVYAVGATMAVPGAAEMIAEKLGIMPQVPEQPGFVAVLGAADTPDSTVSGTSDLPMRAPGLPPLRRLVGLGLPGVLSLALYVQFVFGAQFEGGTPRFRTQYFYVLASWGELAVAALLALLTCLQAASLLGAVRPGLPGRAEKPAGVAGGTISSGVGAAAAGGVAVAGLYAVAAAVYFGTSVSGPLRWSVLPLLPIVGCAVLLAVLAWRRPSPPGGWDAFLAFPISSSIAAALGTSAVSAWGLGQLRPWLSAWENLVGYLGGLVLGVALACTVARHLLARLGLAVFFGFFCLIARSSLGILAVVYAVAVTVWWARRTWALFRVTRPADGPHPAPQR